MPQELGFLMFLKQAKVPLNEYQFPPSKIANVQTQLERLMTKNYYLNKSGKDGFRSYLQAYASHSLKQIFDVGTLDLAKVALAYGFTVPPTGNLPTFNKLVNLLIGASMKTHDRKKFKSAKGGTGPNSGFKKSADGFKFSR